MANFYFTYGSDGQPFCGGWSIVEASNYHAACTAFRLYHPDKTEGILNCASIYSEDDFMRTEMSASGNFGQRCHEIITLRCELTSEGGNR